MNTLMFLGGLVLLLIGGRFLVSGAIDAARRLGVSPLLVGLTLVAWGTSAPELALNLVSAYKGRGDLALGNVVGANICNMALVLGVSALISPLVVETRLIRVEIWLNAAIQVGMAAVGLVIGFSAWVAGAMLAVFAVYSIWTVTAALRPGAAPAKEMDPTCVEPDVTPGTPPLSWVMIGAYFLGGLALLTGGGSLASDGASGLAIGLGVPAAVVGVTVVSIGTTLPELVTSVTAVRRGQTDLAMGNAIGSCLFNAGAIFGMAGLMAPPEVDGSLTVPLIYMGVLSLALIPIARVFKPEVSRLEGAGLLASYAGFLVYAAVRAGAVSP
jgi:cation:H+ antiporter